MIRIADWLERYGQIMPILVVTAEAPHYTLIDGYLRVAAAKRCGKDTLLSHIWHGSEKDALCHVLVKVAIEREWDIFEQAGLIQELHRHYGLSSAKLPILWAKKPELGIATFIDIGLTAGQSMAKSVQRGNIKLGSHTGINTDGARQRRARRKIGREPDKTPAFHRPLFIFFKHYQRSNRKVRENMVNDPQLFIKAEEAGKNIGKGRLS